MNNERNSIIDQLRRNAVALISLVIAVSSLSYNTWRNEKTEDNRNQRFAAFEILLKLGELQQVVFHHHYDKDKSVDFLVHNSYYLLRIYHLLFLHFDFLVCWLLFLLHLT